MKKKAWHILLVQLYAGHWGFPKGHHEEGESPFETASRELQEETGLTVKHLLSEELYEETYFFTFEEEKIKKTVGYYLAEVEGKEAIQKEELAALKWVPFEQAADLLTFPELKKLLKKIQTQTIL